MTREEAEEYAKEMTYRDAVYNALQGKCIPYRKATLIKLHELLDIIDRLGDAISRKAAIDAIWDGINMDIYTREVKKTLEALPPVTVEEVIK